MRELSLPLLWPYLQHHGQFGYEKELARGADLLTYFEPPSASLLWPGLDLPGAAPELPHFLGFVAPCLALVGAVLALRGTGRGQRVLGWLAVVTAVAGGAMALGPAVHVAGRVVAPGPFAALHAAMPLARAMASPERFAALVVLGSAVLIGLGAASLFSAARPRLAAIATLVLAVVLPLEHWSWPRPAALVPAGANRPDAFAFVAQQSTQPLVHLPLYPERSRTLWAAYLNFSTQHWRPIPVGRTSFYPPAHDFLAWSLLGFPDDASLAVLDRLGIRTIVLHPHVWDAGERALRLTAIESTSRLRLVKTFADQVPARYSALGLGEERVYALDPAPLPSPPCAPADDIPREAWTFASSGIKSADRVRDGDRSTSWFTERPQEPGDFLEVRLPEPEPLSAVGFASGRGVGETRIARWSHGKSGAVSLTYDDGSINQFRVAVPIMNGLGLPATFFIITGDRGAEEEGHTNPRNEWTMSRRSATSGTLAAGLAACSVIFGVGAARAQAPVEFEGETDVGDVAKMGSSRFDAARNEYHVVGGGSNMWDDRDSFHFVWRRRSGDLILSTELRFAETSGDAHRKGGWIVRQGLEADAPSADAIVHADGLISLQYRLRKGGETREIQSPLRAPAAVRLERTGDLFTLFVAPAGRSFQPVGSVVVPMNDPVYAGLGVCSHDAARTATGVFSNLGFANPGVVPLDQRVLESSLEVVNVEGAEREAVYVTRDHIEAPNWSRDGRSFLFNSEGRLYELPRSGGKPRLFDTGFANRLNNDHGLSFDGHWLAISHEPEEESLVYVVPAAGGTPRQVTALGPSYWHGWSPDGKTLVYCAERNDEYDVYAIAANAQNSTDERRLTSAPGLDDGPDFSPDGNTIYFNSVRTGRMRIWRMNPDGSDQRQLTFDEAYGDWFPHPSPDGKWIVFLSFDSSVEGHPPNKEVALRIMPASGGEPRLLARLFGGQGTINVPSWSPDSKYVAFVSYRLVKP